MVFDKFLVSLACDEREADEIRAFTKEYFRKIRLRCRTNRSYPESAWCTPAIGCPIEVWAILTPKEGQVRTKSGLSRIAKAYFQEVRERFATATGFSIEFP